MLPGPVPVPRHQFSPPVPVTSASEHLPPRSTASRPRRKGLLLAVLSLSLVGLLAATAGLVVQLRPRTFNTAQKQQIIAWEHDGAPYKLVAHVRTFRVFSTCAGKVDQ